jgi:predicted  nucleic acid-binding Zn-ribbon protein
MSEESGFEVARAYVAVDPDASDFADSLDEQVGGLQVSVMVVPQAADFAQSFDEQVGGLSVTVPVTADVTVAQADIESVIEEASTAQALLKIGADTADALNSTTAFTAEVDGSTAVVTVGADTATGQAAVTALLDEVNEARADLTIGADITGVTDRAGALADELGGNSAEIEVGANTSAARSAVATLVEDVDSERAEMHVGVDASGARDQAEALAEELSGTSADVGLSVSGGGSDSVTALSADMEELAGASDTAASSLSGVQQGIDAVEATAETAASAVAGISGALAGGVAGPAMVHVTPDMSGFGAEVTDAAAGTEVRVRAVPDLSDFGQEVDEATGGLTARVALVPDVADFAQQVDEETAGLTARVTVEADLTQADESVSTFAAGGVTAFAEVEAASTAAAASVDDYWSQPRMLQGLPAAMQASIAAFNGVGQSGAEAAELIEEDFSGIEDRVSSLSAELTALDAKFLSAANAQYGPMTDTQLADMTAMLENLYGELGSAESELAGLRTQLAAAGGEFDGMDAGLGSVTSALNSFEGSLASSKAALEAEAGFFYDQEDAAQRLGVTLDELPAKMEALSASYAAGRAQSEAGIAALTGESAGLAAMGGAAEETAVKAGGLSTVIGELGGKLSYMAVDPFMWMMAAPMVIDGVTSATKALSTELTPLGEQLNEQTKAADYNSASWTQVAATQGKVAQQGGLVGQVMAQAAQQTTSAADELQAHMSTLENEYGLTAAQAQQLAQAAGVSAVQLSASGDAGDKAMSKIQAYADANTSATGPVNELSNDMSTFSNNTLTASTRVSALDDAFNILDGNFVSGQEAQLQVQQDFLTIASNADIAGASMRGTNTQSLQLQQSFYSTIPAIEQTANAMVKQGDSTQQVTAYIEQQIQQLTPLAAHNQQAEQAVQGLKSWEDQLTGSVGENTKALSTAASTLQYQFIAQVKSAGDTSGTTKTAIGNLTTAIIGTGSGSTSSAAARAQLIADLEKSGVNAQAASSDVDAYIKKIAAIPSSKALTLTESASGTWSMSELLSTGAANVSGLPGAKPVAGSASVAGLATGGLVGEGSKIPRADDVDARLSRGEYVVQADAVDHYGAGMLDSINAMHFADGGQVGGSYTGSLGGAGDFAQTQYVNVEDSLAAALEAAINQAESAAKAQAAAAAASTAGAPTSGVAAQNMAALKAAAAAKGWTGAEWDALNQVEMMEAGYSLTATNPGSGAYGMAQFIQGPGEYADYGGNASTAAGQAAAMVNYIAQRYGDPEAALAHEQADHWYDSGGYLPPGQTRAMNGSGVPERVLPPGSDVMAADDVAAAVGGSKPGPTFIVNYYGTMHPTPEQQQAMIMNLTQQLAMV